MTSAALALSGAPAARCACHRAPTRGDKPLGMTRPVIRAWLRGTPIENSDGVEAIKNTHDAGWSSFLTRGGVRGDYRDLADLHGLAQAIHHERIALAGVA